MVNLLSTRRRRDLPLDLDRELSADRRAVLPLRLRDVRRWWRALPVDLAADRRARTPALEPDLEEESSLAALDAALLGLAERRAERLAECLAPREAAAHAESVSGVGDGRLIVCEVDMSIGGGEAQAASRGLFDVDDRPPWDLWLLAWGRTYASRPDEPIAALLAWIPAEWEPLARAGIEACPARCLYWVD